MNRWNVYLVLPNGKMRRAGTIDANRYPQHRLRVLENQHKDEFPGDWRLVAINASQDRWSVQ